jgi:hypothetical protein
MNILVIVVIAAVLIGLGLLGMAVQIIFSKKNKFPNTHIGGNPNMIKHGITCAQSWDKIEQKNAKKIKVEGLKLSNN